MSEETPHSNFTPDASKEVRCKVDMGLFLVTESKSTGLHTHIQFAGVGTRILDRWIYKKNYHQRKWAA